MLASSWRARFEADFEEAVKEAVPARRPRWGFAIGGAAALVALAATLFLVRAGRPALPPTMLPTSTAPLAPGPLAPLVERPPAETPIRPLEEPPVFVARPGAGSLVRGRFAACPPGAPGRRCLRAGREKSHGGLDLTIVFNDRAGLFRYADDLVVAFDYWLGEGPAGRNAYLTGLYHLDDEAGGTSFEWHERKPAARGRWAEAVFPLARFVPQRKGRRPHPDEAVLTLNLGSLFFAEDVFFVTNLRVVRGGPGAVSARAK